MARGVVALPAATRSPVSKSMNQASPLHNDIASACKGAWLVPATQPPAAKAAGALQPVPVCTSGCMCVCVHERMCVCVCVCVCVCARARARVCVCARAGARARVCVCVGFDWQLPYGWWGDGLSSQLPLTCGCNLSMQLPHNCSSHTFQLDRHNPYRD